MPGNEVKTCGMMKLPIAVLLLTGFSCIYAVAQTVLEDVKATEKKAEAEDMTIELWSGGAPEAKGDKDRDRPSISVFLPDTPASNRPAVVICPGGAYGALMMGYEGTDVAKWLHKQGIAGIVVKYRVNPYRHPVPLMDAKRAMRLVRSKAAVWKLNPKKIGIMGFSAGGHVASTVGTHFDEGDSGAEDPVEKQSCRPDFMVLIYPVITMGEKSHGGSRANLLGNKPAAADLELLSNEKHVSDKTPPTFLAHARTDKSVPVENSSMFYSALKARHVPAELLELPEGAHGLGCGRGPLWAQWQAKCLDWFRKQGILNDR